MCSVSHFTVFIATNGLFLIGCHDNRLFLGNGKHTAMGSCVQFTVSNVDGFIIYMHIGCLNCSDQVNSVHIQTKKVYKRWIHFIFRQKAVLRLWPIQFKFRHQTVLRM